MIVQLFLLALLAQGLQVHYLLATLLAVEGAILHNFVWHELWTWKDKRSNSRRALFSRLLRFHLANGTTSLVGNLVLMELAVGHFQIPILAANLLAIAACSIVNFLLSNSFVFKHENKPDRDSDNLQPFYPLAAGPAGHCLCPSCQQKVEHVAGQPCNQQKCPNCGTPMIRE